KSYLGCAFAHKAIRQGHTALYVRLPRLLEDIGFAHGDGRYLKLLTQLGKVGVLVIDDFGLAHLSLQQAHDILEILDDRYQRKSTIVTSQLPVNKWYDLMPDPTVADALLDRLVHNSYTIAMNGESMRKHRSEKGR
ncbi:Transposase subunit, partial [mine drainage metagenome]